jgi:hypothetical protein
MKALVQSGLLVAVHSTFTVLESRRIDWACASGRQVSTPPGLPFASTRGRTSARASRFRAHTEVPTCPEVSGQEPRPWRGHLGVSTEGDEFRSSTRRFFNLRNWERDRPKTGCVCAETGSNLHPAGAIEGSRHSRQIGE